MATAVGPVHDPDVLPQGETVCGTNVCVTSISDALLLPLFATIANPSRGITATPSGFDPTLSGEPIVPTAPGRHLAHAHRCRRLKATSETLPLPEFVTTARSRSVSTATPTGELPTTIDCTTVSGATFETAVPVTTSTAKFRALPSKLAGTVAVNSRHAAATHVVATGVVASGI